MDGSIDWLCLPHFDSPSVFAALLDAERGGRFRIAPCGDSYESLQAYDDDTNVLQTLFRRPGHGAVSLTDHMPWDGERDSSVHELHRFLESREGALEMEVVFDPRFDYARGETRVEVVEDGVVAEGPNGERMSLALGGGHAFESRPEGGVAARFTLRAGQRLWAVLSWRAKRPERIAAYRPFEHLRATRTFWRHWASRLDYDGPWRHDVQRSALMLKLLQFAPTGAMVAAPTTSLPATLDGCGQRNWDYRYSWTRDSAMAIRAMNLIGYPSEASSFFRFVRDTVEERDRLELMVTIHGGVVPDEVMLDHLAGFGGGRPVRIGNDARDQTQHDIAGPLLDAASLYERSGGQLGLRFWRQVRRLVDLAVRHAAEPDHGIWEPRSEPAHHLHSKLMIWVALDRALDIAKLFGGDRSEAAWSEARSAVRADILDRGFDPASGTFVGEYGGSSVDATLLLLPQYGFLRPSDPRVERTVQRVCDELLGGRFVHRYHAGDGIDSPEGAFVLCGFWLAEALALVGRVDEALQVFTDHLSAANHLGLLAEEVDPASGRPLGNFPQAFSHLGLIQAASRLDLALRLRDEGVDEPPLLPSDFPAVRAGA